MLWDVKLLHGNVAMVFVTIIYTLYKEKIYEHDKKYSLH